MKTADAHRLVDAARLLEAIGFRLSHPNYDAALSDMYELLGESKWTGSRKGTTSDKDVLAAFQSGPAFKRRRRQSAAKERQELDKKLKRAERDLLRLIHQFQYGQLDGSELKTLTKDILRNGYFDAYEHGLGATGIKNALQMSGKHMDKADKDFVKSAYMQEARYWNKFMDQIIRNGSAANTARRVKAYVQSMSSMYDAARVVTISTGELIHWLLEDNNACPDCKELHRNSPYTKAMLPTQPKAGLTRCRNNCRCRLVFKEASPDKVHQAEERLRRLPNMIRKMQKAQKAKRK